LCFLQVICGLWDGRYRNEVTGDTSVSQLSAKIKPGASALISAAPESREVHLCPRDDI